MDRDLANYETEYLLYIKHSFFCQTNANETNLGS